MIRRLALTAIILGACTVSGSSGITATDLTCPPDSTLTYADFGKVFLEDNCLSCHTSEARPVLTSLQAVIANKQAIVTAAVTSTAMPRGTTMSVDDRALLGEWLSCGAP